MLLKEYYLKKNACYISGVKHTPKGIMFHSTGANNPKLSRYIPDDGIVGPNRYNNHWDQLEPGGRRVDVHAFIGLDKDGVVRTYNILPWTFRAWGSGTGYLGSDRNANNTGYIQFEICEDGLTDPVYFNRVYKEALELTVMLCKMFNIPVNMITCHSEGNDRGIASNHSDVEHWFVKFGKSMDDVRADVKKMLTPEVVTTPKLNRIMYRVIIDNVQIMALSSLDSAKREVIDRIDSGNGKVGKVQRNDGTDLYSHVKPIPTVVPTYQKHIRGEEVRNLQYAVNQYVGKNVLAVDGFYGDSTKDNVPNNVKKGDVGILVSVIQERLKKLGFYTSKIDKSFGKLTRTAVMKFQKSRGLDEDGIVGRGTFSEMYKR